MKYKFLYADYKLFPYEKEFAVRELEKIFGEGLNYEEKEGSITILTNQNVQQESLEKLTYFKLVEIGEKQLVPKIVLFEKSATTQNRQATRYSAHGLHEYKGKFNPQIVHALLNIMEANSESIIFDPFCGSGTTLLESSLLGYKSVGYDINPLAVFIANTKQKSLDIEPAAILDAWNTISKKVASMDEINWEKQEKDEERLEYLKKWFPGKTLIQIENLRLCINGLDKDIKDILLVIISNNLRDYSNQEPGDLRIRKRRSDFPEIELLEKIKKDVESYSLKLGKSKYIQKGMAGIGKAYLKDNTKYNTKVSFNCEVDIAITSPPYATALPYIDTQRLSLIWLGLTDPKEIMSLERTLTGTRELRKSEINSLVIEIRENKRKLPFHLNNYINMLQSSLSSTDGFRRQAVPALLYNYFSDMRDMFKNVSNQLKKNGKFALVVGTNSTTLGGQKFVVDTPEWLVYIAESIGWTVQLTSKLETYKRYDMHSANSINEETLLILINTKNKIN